MKKPMTAVEIAQYNIRRELEREREQLSPEEWREVVEWIASRIQLAEAGE